MAVLMLRQCELDFLSVMFADMFCMNAKVMSLTRAYKSFPDLSLQIRMTNIGLSQQWNLYRAQESKSLRRVQLQWGRRKLNGIADNLWQEEGRSGETAFTEIYSQILASPVWMHWWGKREPLSSSPFQAAAGYSGLPSLLLIVLQIPKGKAITAGKSRTQGLPHHLVIGVLKGVHTILLV